MPFILQVEKRVRPSIAVVLGHACERMSGLFDFEEKVLVKARNRRWVKDQEGKPAYGIFAHWPRRKPSPYIELACHISVSMREVCHSAFHEFRHYEQYRAKQKLDEDGMNRDADADMRWFVPRMVSLGRWEE